MTGYLLHSYQASIPFEIERRLRVQMNDSWNNGV